jgi:hypothetical protein
MSKVVPANGGWQLRFLEYWQEHARPQVLAVEWPTVARGEDQSIVGVVRRAAQTLCCWRRFEWYELPNDEAGEGVGLAAPALQESRLL